MSLLQAEKTEVAANKVATNAGSKKGKKAKKAFDMSKYHQRVIAIKYFYDGSRYGGLAFQENSDCSIEEELFKALRRTCLAVESPPPLYSRCGRTDKGVSACGQVSVFQTRSCLKPEQFDQLHLEIDYAATLNRVLPPDIRVLAWCPVRPDFSARFDCFSRTYRYFFFARDLDVRRMAVALSKLVGSHDFRNFCKVDPVNVSNFRRQILQFGIHRAESWSAGRASAAADASSSQNGLPFICTSEVEDGRPRPPVPKRYTAASDAGKAEEQCCEAGDLLYFEICGRGFLWHQVRCMVAILFLVGRGLESPSLVDWMLDVSKCQAVPAFAMASDRPLLFYSAAFNNPREIDFSVYRAKRSKGRPNEELERHFQQVANEHRMKCAVASCALETLGVPQNAFVEDNSYSGMGECASCQSKQKQRRYVSLQKRPPRKTLETRVQNLTGKKRRRYDARIEANKQRLAEEAATAAAAKPDPK